MTTTHIDIAFQAAIAAAQALGSNVIRIAPVAVSPLDAGADTETVETMPTKRSGQSGFTVIATLTIGGYRAIRIHETLPAVKETAWPSDIAAEAAQWPLDCIASAEKAIAQQGFTPARLVSCLNMFISALTAAGGNQEALAAAKPKLVAVYSWTQAVQSAAAAGSKMFPPAPFTFEAVFAEYHAS